MAVAGRTVLGNLPAELTSLVGRRRELSEVKRLLSESQLVTLTGVGGTGKTRLALRVAAQVQRAFPDGVWFVDLTELRDSGLLAQEFEDPDLLGYPVAVALGLHDRGGHPPVQQLINHLAGRRAMLVLDNCEHLLPGCAVLVDRLLRDCPGLRILATSREPLAVAGEVLFFVPPLSSPEPDDRLSLADLRQLESVTLFVTRAQAVAPSFDPTVDDLAAVAEICQRLDGLPLAIELAAARVRVLTPKQIKDRLADRFTLLSKGGRGVAARQQTLRGCVDWSFELCSKPEQVLWARLAVFVGGFELDAVEGACADGVLAVEDLLDALAGLVDKSILVRDDLADDRGQVARYRMLDTIRDFGQDQLREAGEYGTFRRQHRDWYEQLVDQAAREWISDRQAYWAARLTREHPNLRAAIEYCLAEPDQADVALRVAVTVPLSHWFNRGNLSELRRWLDRALAQSGTASTQRAAALLLDAHFAIIQGDAELGMRLLDQGEELVHQLGATVEHAGATYVRGVVSLYKGDLPAAVEAFERVGAVLSTVPRSEPGLELRLIHLIALGTATGLAGQHDRADACLQEALAITVTRGERYHRSYALAAQGLSAWRRGTVYEAMTSLAASLRLKQGLGSPDVFGAARCIEAMAWVAAGQQQYRQAAILFGAADALWSKTGTPVAKSGHLIGHHQVYERQCRDALGDGAFTDAFGEGRAMSYHDAIAYALGERRRPATPTPTDGPTPLTRREHEVADLIADGLSNKEISSKLVISRRTAESHVEHILTKLGVTSRAQVAVWQMTQQSRAQDAS